METLETPLDPPLMSVVVLCHEVPPGRLGRVTLEAGGVEDVLAVSATDKGGTDNEMKSLQIIAL